MGWFTKKSEDAYNPLDLILVESLYKKREREGCE